MKNHLPLLRSLCRAVLILTTLLLECVSTAKAQTFPDPPEAERGKVTVHLSPPGIDSGWHFVGEKIWRSSGTHVAGLVPGDREIEFRPVPGYIQPMNKTVSLPSGNADITLTREYYKTPSRTTGRLTVILKPDDIAAQAVATSERARWRILGDADKTWRDSGETLKLPPGAYLIESKPVAGRSTPRLVSVMVLAKKKRTAVATYFVKDSEIGAIPEVLDFSEVNNVNFPYAYVGQIRTSHSLGTGCVVLSNTVATAAHLIFDEEKLTYFGGLQWLFQNASGVYEPVPRIPQRVGILTSYASQRALDKSPGELSARSKSCDVAALFFIESPGRNGSSGYQFSDNSPNEYLTSSNLKTLVCYPIEGIPTANRARMHATTPSNITFTANPDFPDSTANDTYSTSDITSSGGAAGGPVFVQNGSGGYDCVAIYLGASANTVVRSFTEDVDTLFLWANTDGQAPNGGITRVDGTGSGGGITPGAIKITIKPNIGRWKLQPSATKRRSGATVGNLLPGTYTIKFTGVAGFRTPSPVSVIVSKAKLTSLKIKYTPIGSVTGNTTR